MTLEELADFVCDKVGTQDADSVAIAKKFLTRRYQLIWDSSNWADAMAMVSVNTSTSHPFLLMPPEVGRVISIRDSGNNPLSAIDTMTLFAYRPDFWDTSGTPVGFSHVAPAVCGASSGAVDIPWFLTGYPSAQVSDPGYADFAITFEKVDGTTVELKRFEMDSEYISLGSYFWVLSASVSFDLTEAVNTLELRETSNVGTTRVAFVNPNGTSYVRDNASTTTLNPAPRLTRIRLMQKPETSSAMLCLCKRSVTRFDEDHHVPQINDIENALICMAHGDMLQRQRQYTKAQQQFAEAQTHIRLRLDLERNQTASNLRIIPSVEPYNIYGTGSNKAYF